VVAAGTTPERKLNAWHTRTAEAVLFVTSLTPTDATPADLLAHVRGHWSIEHTHWLRDVVWKEDDSLLRTGDSPQLWSALTNLAINLFRLLGVTGFTREIRRNTQDPQRILHLLTS
jgi:predicted transposase YbfD/YdcC